MYLEQIDLTYPCLQGDSGLTTPLLASDEQRGEATNSDKEFSPLEELIVLGWQKQPQRRPDLSEISR